MGEIYREETREMGRMWRKRVGKGPGLWKRKEK